MRNARLHALFTKYEIKINKFCNIWSSKIGHQINIQYPIVESDDWEKCRINPDKRAIMFVGQIPGKWESTATSVIDGMEYSDKIITENYYGSSPFFQFMAKFVSEINMVKYEDARFCYYWTNIFRISTNDKDTSDKLKNYYDLLNTYINMINTLPEEINIVEPDAIIFLTGPEYDQYLQQIFSCSFQSVQTIDRINDKNFLSRVISNDLPKKTFRIYHPRALIYKGKSRKNSLINTIKSII